LVVAVQQNLPVTARHERWLNANPEITWSEKAKEHAFRVFNNLVGGNRERTPVFRASGAEQCPRRRVFAQQGAPLTPEAQETNPNIFATGNFLHLKWQMMGLTEGWLEEAEVPAQRDDIRLGGTMDGILYNGNLFEFKTINSRGFSWVMKSGPKQGHLFQTHYYMELNPEMEGVSVIYENKDDNNWREFWVPRDPAITLQVQKDVEYLNECVDSRVLPPVKPDCAAQKGTEYRQCPYKGICLKTRGWLDGDTSV
jgi:hypothetical protein